MPAKAGAAAALAALLLLPAARPAAGAEDLRLVEAVRQRDEQALRRLLAEQAPVNARQPDGATALHWAVHWNDLAGVELLLRAGADVAAANDYGVTPLSLACTNGDPAVARRLLESGADANAASPVTGETVLMTAARTGVAAVVGALLDHGADPSAQETRQGQTALMWAAADGHVDAARVLIARGADLHARSRAGSTPLLFAARTGNLALVRLLLEAGADVNDAAADGSTALLVATVRSDIALARLLLEHGADPDRGPGFNPLHWAAGNWRNVDTLADAAVRADNNEWSGLEGMEGQARRAFVQLLLDFGADPNAPAAGTPGRYAGGQARGGYLAGATSFLAATRTGDTRLMQMLLDAGADPLQPNGRGTTPLMIAAGVGFRGYSPVPEADALAAVELCVELGNDVRAADTTGETALHGAAYRGLSGSDTIIRFLVDRGAELNVENGLGWTPLAIAEGVYFGASDTRSDDMAALFRTLGAEPTPPGIERDVNIARLNAQRAADRQGGSR